MIGKLDPAALDEFVSTTGAPDPAVHQGPAYGEDAAAIDLGETTLVVSSDPLSLASKGAARLAIHVGCNDVAACGGDPRWVSNVIFLPDDDPDTRERIAHDLGETAADLDVSIVGGHTEYLSSLDRPLLSMTVLGTTDRYIPSGGASPGDRILLTKGAGIEATAILATDFAEDLSGSGVDDRTIESAETFFDLVSVIPDSRVLRDVATAMHDPTEGGVIGALVELARAGDVRVTVAREDVPVRPETRACCDALDVDPLATFGSGGLLATVPDEDTDAILASLDEAGIEAAVIGVVGERAASTKEAGLLLDGEFIHDPPRDELYPLWEE